MLAKGDTHHAVFWAYACDRTAATPALATPILTVLAPGRHTVCLWDPWQGRELAPIQTVTRGGCVGATLPTLTRDLAGLVTPAIGQEG